MNMYFNLLFFDHKISESIIYLRSDFFDKFFFIITKIGDWQTITCLFVLISIFFWIRKKKDLILPLFVILAGSGIMTVIIKLLVGRTRPGAGIALYIESLPSFPSAHATLVFALFGFLVYCIFRFNQNMFIKVCWSIFIFSVISLVGFSRLYLGVHFLSDVLAGYLIGLMWVLIGMYISRSSFSVLNHDRF